MDARQQLRRQMRAARRALTPQQQKQAAQRLLGNLCSLSYFIRAQHIALYLPSDGEIDPRPLLERCWAMGKQTYLPILHPVRHNRLWFAPYDADTIMTRNCYGIEEPDLVKAPRRPAWALDLVLLPLVAFDADGGRMGMGGGYYDRTFAYTRRTQHMRGPTLLGLAHELQKVDSLPVASWDIPLTGIVTDQQHYLAAV
ncbi:5-formyltetrahydrofolate cyclo-ligase [Marinobacterium arenosum]|uniref:5-formyltetrahydrofolate cyclo-ligase n=1 Tax=Marinobacterium arenosum TaxID=2862496 RepID=UPI001C95672D|nr:5-formyltetrahydrofolate cyclo-ligase [Marinobacterium arenosum]MBY4676903.1 5-formyltetrahydrofolate cyclo-ligase [Marinobacterium arenosum]